MGTTEASAACSPTRGPARCQAILEATLDVLSETGFDAMTIDGVAAKARASKATIYRNWEGKTDLVAEAVAKWPGIEITAPDTGSLRGDLLAICRFLHDKLNSRQGNLFTGLLHAIQDDPALAETLREQTHVHVKAVHHQVIERAVARGEISGCPDPELVFSIAPAVMFFRHLFSGEPVDEQLLVQLVDDVLLPALDRGSR